MTNAYRQPTLAAALLALGAYTHPGKSVSESFSDATAVIQGQQGK